MALIVCPECGKKFSDRAVACPECGCPTSEIVGQNNDTSKGQLLIANNAFNDGRYEEAYQLFAQLYSQTQNDSQIVVRLGLATAAKDYFSGGLPNSTKELLSKGLELAKGSSSSYDEFVSTITPFVVDAKKIISDTRVYIANGVSSTINEITPTRSAGAMIADALFAPAVSADRNLYEDRRTIDNNNKIIDKALADTKAIIATLDTFSSYVLNQVANTLSQPLDNNSSLYEMLGGFVNNAEDAKIYEKISAKDVKQSNVFGLCYGKETTILDLKDVGCNVHVNNKPRVKAGVFDGTPCGNLLLTNYKIVYNATKSKFSFEQSLEKLINVELGGPMNLFITLNFPNNLKILIMPDKSGKATVAQTYVAAINKVLKLSS